MTRRVAPAAGAHFTWLACVRGSAITPSSVLYVSTCGQLMRTALGARFDGQLIWTSSRGRCPVGKRLLLPGLPEVYGLLNPAKCEVLSGLAAVRCCAGAPQRAARQPRLHA